MTAQLDRPLAGRVAIVTGAGRGIGRAACLALAEAGSAVAGASRTGSELNDLAREIEARGVSAYVNICDVAEPDHVQRFVQRAREVLGPIDILVAAAGIFHAAPILDHRPDAFERQMATNVKGTFLFVREVAGEMVERGRGQVVGICSIASYTPFAGASAYCASKFAQLGFLRAAALELRDRGVRVTAVSPGATATSLWNFDDPTTPAAERMLDPQQVAQAVLWVLTRPMDVVVDELRLTPPEGIL